MEKQEQNIFITALSNLNNRFQYYGYKIGEATYLGGFSGEPGIRFAIRELAKEGKLFDRFVLLCSKETMKEIDVINALKTNYKCEEADDNEARDYQIKEFLGTDLKDAVNDSMTGKEKSDFRDSLRQISAFDYILEVIKDEIKQANFKNLDVDEYIQRTCFLNDQNDGPLMISDNPDIGQLKANIERQFDYGKTTNLHVDITGGTRITSIVSLLIARWYEQRKSDSFVKARVKKVIYSSIMDNPKVIIDWTDNYELFKLTDSKTRIASLPFFVPNLFNSNLFDDESQSKIKLYLKESEAIEGLNSDEIQKRLAVLDMAMEKLQEITSMEALDSLEKVQNAISAYSQTVIEREYLEEKKKNGDIYVENKAYISSWYGRIMNDIANYIEIKDNNIHKSTVVQLSQQNEQYYEKYNRTGVLSDCVLSRVKDMIKYSYENNEKPKDVWNDYQCIDSPRYDSWNDNYSARGGNKFFNKVFLLRLQERTLANEIYNHKIKTRGDKRTIIPVSVSPDNFETLLLYEKLRNLYYNFGFPFACIDKNNNLLDIITEYYVSAVNTFIDNIDKAKEEGDISRYEKILKEITEEEAPVRLRQVIPLFDILKLTKIKNGLFKNINEAEQCFKDFSSVYEKVRPVRNAIAHPEEPKLKEFRTPEKVKCARDEILEWMDTYMNLDRISKDDKSR